MKREQNQLVTIALPEREVRNRMFKLCGPKQQSRAWMFTALWESILDASDDDVPFSLDLTVWAKSALECDTVAYFYNNPDQVVCVEWPFIPMGEENVRLHGLWDALRLQYRRMKEAVADNQATEKAIEEFESVHGSTTDAERRAAFVALARESKAKWQMIGGRGCRR